MTAECTGLTARWCPIHGDCTCHGDELDDSLCALHSPASEHATNPDCVAIHRCNPGQCIANLRCSGNDFGQAAWDEYRQATQAQKAQP